jgi:hypothetical protein
MEEKLLYTDAFFIKDNTRGGSSTNSENNLTLKSFLKKVEKKKGQNILALQLFDNVEFQKNEMASYITFKGCDFKNVKNWKFQNCSFEDCSFSSFKDLVFITENSVSSSEFGSGNIFFEMNEDPITYNHFTDCFFANVVFTNMVGEECFVGFESCNFYRCVYDGVEGGDTVEFYNDLKALNSSFLNLQLMFSSLEYSAKPFEFSKCSIHYCEFGFYEEEKSDRKHFLISFVDSDFLEAVFNGVYPNEIELDEDSFRRLMKTQSGISFTGFEETDLHDYYPRFGLNGINITSPELDVASIVTTIPKSNSMKGPSIDAVLDNMKKARHLFGYSFALVAIVLYAIISGFNTFRLPFFSDVGALTVQDFGWVALVSIGVIYCFVIQFLNEALDGAVYLRTQQDAVRFGSFPWSLTKYAHREEKSLNKLKNWFKQKFRTKFDDVLRWFFIFHPLVALGLFFFKPFNFQDRAPWWFLAGAVAVITVCLWLLRVTNKFQRPLLFDPETERNRKTPDERMAEALASVEKKLDDLINRLPGGANQPGA